MVTEQDIDKIREVTRKLSADQHAAYVGVLLEELRLVPAGTALAAARKIQQFSEGLGGVKLIRQMLANILVGG